jgi:hypothetical protein
MHPVLRQPIYEGVFLSSVVRRNFPPSSLTESDYSNFRFIFILIFFIFFYSIYYPDWIVVEAGSAQPLHQPSFESIAADSQNLFIDFVVVVAFAYYRFHFPTMACPLLLLLSVLLFSVVTVLL